MRFIVFRISGPRPVRNILPRLLTGFLSVYLVKNGKKPVGNRAFLTQSFQEQGMKYTNERLENIIADIAQLDSDLRRSTLKPEMALQMLAVTLTGERKQ